MCSFLIFYLNIFICFSYLHQIFHLYNNLFIYVFSWVWLFIYNLVEVGTTQKHIVFSVENSLFCFFLNNNKNVLNLKKKKKQIKIKYFDVYTPNVCFFIHNFSLKIMELV